MERKRATTDRDRAARRRHILRTTTALLEQWSFDDVNMDRIAHHAGVAKGTVYLYFRTREELMLEVFDRHHEVWFNALETELRAMPEGVSAAEVSRAAVSTLLRSPLLIQLFGRVNNLFGGSVSLEAAYEFKLRQQRRIESVGSALERQSPGLTKSQAERWLLRLEAFVIGSAPLALPSPAIARVIERPELTALRIDLGTELYCVAFTMLSALQETPRSLRPQTEWENR